MKYIGILWIRHENVLKYKMMFSYKAKGINCPVYQNCSVIKCIQLTWSCFASYRLSYGNRTETNNNWIFRNRKIKIAHKTKVLSYKKLIKSINSITVTITTTTTTTTTTAITTTIATNTTTTTPTAANATAATDTLLLLLQLHLLFWREV